MKPFHKIRHVGTVLTTGAIALAVNAQLVFASSNDMSSGYTNVVGSTPTDVVSEITKFTQFGMKILAAVAAAWTLFHLVKAGLAMMSGSGMRKEEGVQQLKMTVIGGVVALGAYFFAGVIGAIAGSL